MGGRERVGRSIEDPYRPQVSRICNVWIPDPDQDRQRLLEDADCQALKVYICYRI